MTKPINTKIAPLSPCSVSFNPGIPVYTVKIFNHNNKEMATSVSYDRATGTLCVNVMETGA